jgi:hypothetical protein
MQNRNEGQSYKGYWVIQKREGFGVYGSLKHGPYFIAASLDLANQWVDDLLKAALEDSQRNMVLGQKHDATQ